MRACTLGALLLACAGAPTLAHAGGFEIPDTGARAVGRGGAMAVGVEDLTAMHYNPGALAKQRGTTLLYNHNLTFHRASFARAPLTSSVWGVDQSFARVDDAKKVFPLGLFAVVGTDFGLKNWTFAAGVYGPSAVGAHDYPDYGPQSFQLTEMSVLLAYYNLSAAWKWRDKFGIGATLQWVDMIQMKYSLVVDGAASDELHPVPGEDTQLTTALNLKDHTAATALLGLWYRPHRRVELGIASRVVPVFLKARGGVDVDKSTLVTRDIRVELPLTLPANLRAGVRYIHEIERAGKTRRWFDLELDVFYENWSTIENFELRFDGAISGQELGTLKVPKQWKDTVSVRLGGDFIALPPYLTVRAGGFFESPTQDKQYSHLDFPAFMRGGIGAGASAGAKGVYFTVGYMHVFQETRTISEAQAQVFQQRPLAPCPAECDGLSGVPANAGTFRSSFDLLNLGLEIRFAELLAGRTRKREQERNAAATPARSVAPAPPAPAGRGTAAPTAAPATPGE
ncbi:MAG: outer membrane protein transport protein [Deltaproteobacteria bacterium]|nr:outer membrane protein transport protein [Nannocystaceae bacterium]